jgi:predicted Na+-dependent transporter
MSDNALRRVSAYPGTWSARVLARREREQIAIARSATKKSEIAAAALRAACFFLLDKD